jgi:hypothetical protein
MKSFAQVIRSLRTAAFAGACAGLMMLSSAASAALVSTGLDASGNLATADNTVDPNWTVRYLGTVWPTFAPTPAAQDTYAVVTAWPVAPAGPWIGYDGISNWISPSQVPSSGHITSAPGYYAFTATFTVNATGADLAAYLVHGRFAVDNAIVYVMVNNNYTGITLGGEYNYQQWTTLDINNLAGWFQTGNNTLTFLVQNLAGESGNPVGLRVEIPEPGTLALVGLALVGFGVARKRKQQ